MSLSNSDAKATSSKKSLKVPLESTTSSSPSTKSFIPLINSSIFSILLIDSGVPSDFKTLIIPILLITCSTISKALSFSFNN